MAATGTSGRRPASSGPRPTSATPTSSASSSTSQEFPTRQDARIAQMALESGRPLVIVLNKWDLVDKDAVRPDAVRERVFRKLGFVAYAPLIFISARTGQRIVKILDTAEQVYKGATTRVETSKLNDFLARTTEAHPPRLKNGARAKLRYMTQKGVSPPTFILFLGSRGPLSPTYEKHFHRVPAPGIRLRREPHPAHRPDELSRAIGESGPAFFLTLSGLRL